VSTRSDFLLLVHHIGASAATLAVAMKVPEEFLPVDENIEERFSEHSVGHPLAPGLTGDQHPCFKLLTEAAKFVMWMERPTEYMKTYSEGPSFMMEWYESVLTRRSRTVKVSCSGVNEGDDWQAFWEALLEHVEAMEEDHDPLESLDRRIYENLLVQGEPGVELFITPAEAQAFREWLEALPCYVHARPPFIFQEGVSE